MAEIEELAGSTVGNFRFLKCLGHGTHTAVYSALDSTGGSWAVKVVGAAVEPEDGLLRRLRQDAERLAELEDPTFLGIRDPDRDGRYTFAASRLVEGQTLGDLMSRGPIDTESAWDMLSTLAEALDRARRAGLSYRVLKPSNVILGADGRAYLAEFGMAGRLTGPMALASPGYRLGYPQYLAPEQVEGADADDRTDVYSAAVLVFELLTGTPLFAGPNAAEILRAVKLTPPPSAHARNAGLPLAVDHVLARGLAKDPEQRPHSVWGLLDDLVSLPDPRASAPPIASETTVAILRKMGIPVLEFAGTNLLNSYLACMMRHARAIAGPHWADVLAAGGLQSFLLEGPPDDGKRMAPAQTPGRLADGFETVFGVDSRVQLRELGRVATEEWMEATQRRPFRMMGRASTKVSDLLLIFTSSMDRVRGEPLHAWKPIDDRQFWILHYANLFTLGRRRQDMACHFWIGAYQAALHWAGLGRDWMVDEEECGCVTGTENCVFTIKRA